MVVCGSTAEGSVVYISRFAVFFFVLTLRGGLLIKRQPSLSLSGTHMHVL